MQKTKKKSLFKKLTALVVTFVSVFSMMSESIFTVAKAFETKHTEYELEYWGYDFRNSGLPNAYDPIKDSPSETSPSTYANRGYFSGSNAKYATDFYYWKDSSGRFSYCVQFQVDNVSTSVMESFDLKSNYSNYYTGKQAEYLRYATIYSYKGKTKYGYTWEQELVASQALVWAISARYFDDSTTDLGANEKILLNCITSEYSNASTQLANMKACYKKMKADILSHKDIPTKTADTIDNLTKDNVFKLTYNFSTNKWVATVPSNATMTQFDLKEAISGVTVTHSGNNLVFTCSSTAVAKTLANESYVTLKKNRSKNGNAIEECTPVFLATKSGSSTSQAKVSYYDNPDPVEAYVAFELNDGTMTFTKTATDADGDVYTATEELNKLLNDGAKFKMFQTRGNPYDSTTWLKVNATKSANGRYVFTSCQSSNSGAGFVLADDGTFSVANLPVGTYYIWEYATADGYELEDTVTNANGESIKGNMFYVNVTASGTTITGTNTQKTTTFTLTKQLRDNNGVISVANSTNAADLNADARFVLIQLKSGTSDYKNASNWSIVPLTLSATGEYKFASANEVTELSLNSDGKLIIENLPNGQYYLVEIKTADGYTLPDEYTDADGQTAYGKFLPFTTTGGTVDASIVNTSTKDLMIEKHFAKYPTNTMYNAMRFKVKNETTGNWLKLTSIDSVNGIYEYAEEVSSESEATEILLGTTSHTASVMRLNEGEYTVKELPVTNYVVSNGYSDTDRVLISATSTDTTASFHNDFVGNIVVNKYSNSNTNVLLSGAEFTVYNDVNGNGDYEEGIDTVVGLMVENNGKHTLNNLLSGKYLVKETKAPANHEIDENFYAVTIDNVGETVEVKNSTSGFINEMFGHIKTTKYSKADTTKPLTGTIFTVYNDVNKNGQYDEGTDTTIGDMTEDADKVHHYYNLPMGMYLVKETTPPANHVVDDNYYSVTIDVAGETEEVKNTDAGFVNDYFGNIVVNKYSDADTSVLLIGAEFTVYKDVNENSLYDETIDTVVGVMDENDGKHSMKNLLSGYYLVKETVTPANHTGDDNYYSVVIDVAGETEEVKNDDAGFINNLYGHIRLVKYSLANITVQLSGAEFEVISDNNQNGVYDEFVDTLYGKMTENNGVHTLNNLPKGHYLVKEVKSPLFHFLDTKYYPVEINVAGETENIVNMNGIFTNNFYGNIKVVKYSKADLTTPISGAKYEVYNDVDKNGEYDATIDTLYDVMEENNGTHTLKTVPSGYYLVKETECPEFHTLDEKYYPVVIDIAGETEEVKNSDVGFVNDFYGNIVVNKFSDSDTNVLLSGAEFTVYNDVNGNAQYDADVDTLVGVMIEENGKHIIKNLLSGDYLVKETKTPANHVGDDTYYAVTIDVAGETEEIKNSNVGFVNKMYAHIVVNKYSDADTSVQLTGAEFTVFSDVNANEKYDAAIDTIVGVMTEANGKHTMNNLPMGHYLVRETKTPANHFENKTYYPVNLDVAGETEEVKNSDVGFVNELYGHIVINKYSKEDLGNPISGAVFEIYKDVNGNLLYEAETDVYIGRCTENNGVHTYNNLKKGSYLVKESKAPANHKLDDNYYPVIIDIAGETEEIKNSDEGFVNDFYGNIIVNKYSELSNTELLKGAEFTVISDINKNGEYDVDIDTVVGVMLEDKGTHLMTNLLSGYYLVKETKTSPDYKLDTNYYPVIIDVAGETEEVKNSDVGFINYLQVRPFEFTKTDFVTAEPLENCGIRIYDWNKEIVFEGYTNENGQIYIPELKVGKYYFEEFEAPESYVLQEGLFVFEVTVDKTIIKATMTNNVITGSLVITKTDVSDGKLIPNCKFAILDEEMNVIFTDVTDEQGLCEFTLEYGKYYYQELEAAEGYVLDTTPYAFEIKEDGEIVRASMTNEKIEGSLVITKTDVSDGKLIPNCKFAILDEEMNVIFTDVTDEQGLCEFTLEYGKYYYQELEAAEGYVIDTTPYAFEIKEDGEIIRASMTNEKIEGSLVITKTDVSDGKLIPNCKFAILDEEMNVIFTDVTDEQGLCEFTLEYGKYYYQELEAAEGYVLDTTPYAFEIKEDGEIVRAEMTNELITGKIEITKTDVATGDLLAGAIFDILDEAGNVVATPVTDEDGMFIVTLGYGKYTIIEKSAPSGYVLDKTPYKFEITEDGVVIEKTITNAKEIVTGIETNDVSGYAVSFGILVLILIVMLKKKVK